MSSHDGDMSEQTGKERSQSTPRRTSPARLVLTILLLVAGIVLAVLVARRGPPPGFDPALTAYSLAQQAQEYRKKTPSRRNYCVIVLLIEDSNGKITQGPRQLFYGFGKESNVNHCEQNALRGMAGIGLPQELKTLSLPHVTALHFVLFSQVRTCDPCKDTFLFWEQQLRQQVAAKRGGSAVRVDLYGWEIAEGSPSGFDPSKYQAGPYTLGPAKPRTRKPVPVRRQDLNQVYP